MTGREVLLQQVDRLQHSIPSLVPLLLALEQHSEIGQNDSTPDVSVAAFVSDPQRPIEILPCLFTIPALQPRRTEPVQEGGKFGRLWPKCCEGTFQSFPKQNLSLSRPRADLQVQFTQGCSDDRAKQ